jgi:hypothetical protein
MIEIPDSLVEAIQSGRCIAFVGAGFSRPGNILLWSELLRKLTYQHVSVDSDAYKYLVKVLGPQDSSNVLAAHELDLAAQVLEDKVENFRDILRQEIRNGQLNETMNQRISAMQQIPFRALLTTNYDSFLVGKKGDSANGDATRPTFQEILQGPTRDWFDMLIDHAEGTCGYPVVHLHGEIEPSNSAVITRQDYRRRLHESPGYLTFLRSVMASYTILYLGFSFTDAYLNELRSEVRSMLGSNASGPQPKKPQEAPRSPEQHTAYALVADVDPEKKRYFLAHEGVEVIGYEAGVDHAPFNEFLGRLRHETNPIVRFGEQLAGKRILWVDQSAANNTQERQILNAIAERSAAKKPEFIIEDSFEHAHQRLASSEKFDLLITSWGGDTDSAPGPKLLRHLRAVGLVLPAIVYAGKPSEDRRLLALGLGALSYETTRAGLFRTVYTAFTPSKLERLHNSLPRYRASK